MLVEPAKPNDLKGMCRAINRLSGGKMEQKASELDSVVTSGVNSIIDSAIASIETTLSDATSAVQSNLTSAVSDLGSKITLVSDQASTNSNTLSAVSNLAQANSAAIDSVVTDLNTYESALSDATSGAKASAASELASTAKVLSDATSDARSLASAATGITESHLNSTALSLATMVDSAISDVVATNTSDNLSLTGHFDSAITSTAKVLSDVTSEVKASSQSELASAISNLNSQIQAMVDSAISDVVATNTSDNLSLVGHFDSAILSTDTVLKSDIASVATALDSAISDVVATNASDNLSLGTQLLSDIASIATMVDSAISDLKALAHSELLSQAKILSDAASDIQSGLDSAVSDLGSKITIVSDMASATSNVLSAISNIHTDVEEPTGFVDRTAVLSWDDGTYTLTITGSHDIYINGVKSTKSTGSIQIADTTGIHWVYYDVAGTLSESTARPDFSLPLMAVVYWNTTVGFDKGLAGEERHGIVMDWATHEYLHYTVGSRYESGLTGTFDNTTLTITTGKWHDEDIEYEPAQQTTCNVLYKNGSAAWEWDAGTTVYYKLNGTALRYNNGNNLADCAPNRYMAMWIFATNDISVPIIALMGQREDTTIADARANNTYESLSFDTLPFEEMKLLYRVILRSTGSPPTYTETQDFRVVSNLPAGTYVATAHGTLTGLDQDDHTQYALDSALVSAAKDLSDATSVVQSGLTSAVSDINSNIGIISNTLSAVSNLAQSNAMAVASIETLASDTLASLHTYESALSNETSAVKASAAADAASLAIMVDSAISGVVATAVTETASLATAIASVESTLSSVIVSTATSIVNHMDSAIASIETTLSQATSDAYSLATAGGGGGITESHLNSTALSLATMVDSAISGVVATNTSDNLSLVGHFDSAVASTETVLSDATSDAYSLATAGYGTFVDRGDPASEDFTVGDFTTDYTWRDLSLSAIVPAGAKAVLLRAAVRDNLVNQIFEFRKNGNTNDRVRALIRTQVADISNDLDLICACDEDRIVEYRGLNTTFTVISVVVKGWWI